MEEMLNYLKNNPEEAFAIGKGEAIPIGLKPDEFLKVIKIMKKLVSDKTSTVMKYWA